jgi:hypothetical protein
MHFNADGGETPPPSFRSIPLLHPHVGKGERRGMERRAHGDVRAGDDAICDSGGGTRTGLVE